MIKKWKPIVLSITLGGSLLTVMPSSAQAAPGISIVVDGQVKNYQTKPILVNNRVLVPFRELAVTLGADVQWDASTRKVTAKRGKMQIEMQLDADHALIDGNTFYPIDVKPELRNDRLLVPLRLFSETFGAKVGWDDALDQVSVSTQQTAFFDALLNNDQQKVRGAVESGVDPNSARLRLNALQITIQKGYYAMGKLLIELGANPHLIDYAAGVADPGMIDLLLDNGVNANERWSEEAYAPLFSAAHRGSLEAVKALLNGGADVNREERWEGTPLSVAVQFNRTQVVQMLLNKGADPDRLVKGKLALNTAATNGNVDLVQILLKGGADPNVSEEDGWTPLMIAAANGNPKLIEALLAADAKLELVNEQGTTAWMIARGHGHTESMKLLEAQGAKTYPSTGNDWNTSVVRSKNSRARYSDVTVAEWTPLMKAAYYGQKSKVQELLAQGADVNHSANHISAPLLAAHSGNVEIAKELVDAGAKVGDEPVVQHYFFSTLLTNDQEIGKLLVTQGLDFNAVFDDKRAPMEMTAYLGNLELLRFLLANGAKVDVTDMSGSTGLQIALQQNYSELVKVLVEAGANPNITSRYFPTTPLEMAVEHGQLEAVDSLLSSPSLTQKTKDAALRTAVQRGSESLIQKLRDAGAKL